MSATEFRSYGERGAGRWITIYAREGHSFAVIAGLRLDTTPFDHYIGKWAPRWYGAYRPPRGFDASIRSDCEFIVMSDASAAAIGERWMS